MKNCIGVCLRAVTVLTVGCISALSLFLPASAQQQSEAGRDVEEITVTVERREQNLQDLPGTAASFSGEDLKLLGIQDIADLDGSLPGLSIANNAGNIEVYIRGVGSNNNTELGDPAAATHLNGVYVPRPSGFGAAFFDIERVEINIGPQGTLRGRNATAGSINVISWKPGIGETDGMLEFSGGDYDENRFEGMVNLPVTENSALRVAGFSLQHDSYYENENPDSADLGLSIPTSEFEGIRAAEEADDLGVRATYLIDSLGVIHPTLENLSWTLTGDYIEQKGTGYTGTNYASLLGAGLDPDSIDDDDSRVVYVRPITPEEDTEHWGIKSQFDLETPWFNVEYISSYRDLVYDYRWAGAADTVVYPGALDDFEFDNFSRIRSIADSESEIHELRFFDEALGSLPLQWTAGAFYFEEEQRTFLGNAADRNTFFQGNEFIQRTDTESRSVYSDLTWSVTDRFRLTGGVRYTEDEKKRTGVNASYRIFAGGANFAPSGYTRIGTEGFRFRGTDRTIINPDTDGDGSVSVAEYTAFYRDGVAQFGARDTFDDFLDLIDEVGVFGGGLDELAGDERPTCSELADAGLQNYNCADDLTELFNAPGLADLVDRATYIVANGSSFALQRGRLDNDFVDWRLRAEYDVGDDNLLYGLIATGNKSGGFNDNLPSTDVDTFSGAALSFDATTAAPTYDEEHVTLYEIGSKNEFDIGDFFGADVGFRFNASGFYYDYEDLQVFNLLSSRQILTFQGLPLPEDLDDENRLGGNVVGFTFNAADAEIYGFQLDGGLRFPNDWNFDYTFLRLEATIEESIPVQDSRFQADVNADYAVFRSIEGHSLPRTPRYQFNASLSKAFRLDSGIVDAVISAGYRSSQHMTIFNGEVYGPITRDDGTVAPPLAAGESARLDDEVEGYWTFDVGAGFTTGDDDALRLEAYVSNLTDEQRETAIIITQFDNTRFFRAPRAYGVRLRWRF